MKGDAEVAGQKSVGIRRKGRGRGQWRANSPYIYVQDEMIAREWLGEEWDKMNVIKKANDLYDESNPITLFSRPVSPAPRHVPW